MAYEIRTSDGNILIELGDGLTDTAATSLTLLGKNVSQFGKIQNENLVHLLENFASDVEPANNLVGQIWFDKGNNVLKYTDLYQWKPIAVISTDQSVASGTGNLWINTTTSQLFLNINSQFSLVGPEAVPNFGQTRIVATTVTSTTSVEHPILKIMVGGEVVGVISTTTFDTAQISGVGTVFKGITTRNYATAEFPFYGLSAYSSLATRATGLNGGVGGSIPYQNGTSSTTFLSIGSPNTILVSNGSAPSWQALNTLTFPASTSASNLAGGYAGWIPYQTSPGNTSFISIGANKTLLQSNGSTATFVSTSSIHVGTAALASQATTAVYSTTKAVNDDSTFIATTAFVHDILPYGSIIMWYGTSGSVPTGWQICDGTNGTPDLRNKFVVGAGSLYARNATGGSKDASVISHAHTITDPGHTHTPYTSASAPWNGTPRAISAGTSGSDGTLDGSTAVTGYDSNAVPLLINSAVTGITVNTTGTSGVNANMPPYHALFYIMKIY